jgi:hypothetical protein
VWLFRKKHPALSELPVDGKWQVSKGRYDGRPLIVRVNTSADPFRGHPELSNQAGIAVPFKLPSDDGMPSSAEVEELNEIEDRLFEIFETGQPALVVAVITTSGMREFVLYGHNPEDLSAKHRKLQAQISHHEIQLMIQADPDWMTFKRFR